MMQKVPVKILREGAALPTYGTASSAGADPVSYTHLTLPTKVLV